jgi:hypothetical protein
MNIFGKPLGEYVRFCRPFILLVAVIGITRLALSLAGAPNATATWFSMTAVAWIGVFYYAVRVHSSGFGTYKHLLPIVALINLTAQAIAIVAIVIAIVTGTNNIFSAPEYAFGSDGKTWLHVGAHLVVGTTVGTLIPWLTGSLIMFISTKLSRQKRAREAARA